MVAMGGAIGLLVVLFIIFVICLGASMIGSQTGQDLENAETEENNESGS